MIKEIFGEIIVKENEINDVESKIEFFLKKDKKMLMKRVKI